MLFLELDEVLEIHHDQIERYGGTLGIRDIRLLESALAMPRAGIAGQYFHTDLCETAAAYLFHLVMNHPFLDGNKRVGAMAAFTFLKLNGHTLNASAASFEKLVLSVASGKADKLQVATFFRDNVEG